MPIVLSCHCGRKLQIREEFAGQEGKCPVCGRTLHIPLPGAEGPPAAPLLQAIPLHKALPPEEGTDEPLTNHGGGALPPDADFFVPPPAEIGDLITAHTTLGQGLQPWSPGGRLVGAGVAGLVGLAVGALPVAVLEVSSNFWQAAWPLGGGIVGLTILLLATRFTHTCTYVGREGVARYVCSGARDHLTEGAVFLFRDATELRTAQTLHYLNGAYQNTTYAFHWYDVGGRRRYSINGSHNSKAGTPPPADFYHFGRSAEAAWSNYLLAQVARQVELAGSVLFNVQRGQWVRLGPGTITFCLGGEPEEFRAADIARVRVDKGVVRFYRTDARPGWFSSRGVYEFPFEHLANAQLFFHLLSRLVGIRPE